MFISIDLSIKSPGIAINYKSDGVDKYVLYSFTEYKVNEDMSYYGEIEKSDYVVFFTHNNILSEFKKTNTDIRENYFLRIKNNAKRFIKLLDNTIQMLSKFDDDAGEYNFSMEGYSYAAVGMSYDIAEYGGIIKYFIEEKYKTKVVIIEPTRIKKFAYKGNARKNDMVDAAMRNNKNIEKIFNEMKEYYIRKKSNKNPLYESPFNDLVDAYFQLQLFKDMKKKNI